MSNKPNEYAKEPLEYWGCGEPHLLRNYLHQVNANIIVHNIQ